MSLPSISVGSKEHETNPGSISSAVRGAEVDGRYVVEASGLPASSSRTMTSQTSSVPGTSGSSRGATAAAASAVHIPHIVGGDEPLQSKPTPEQAMDALMSEYEKELQTPLRGIVMGSLMTAILIQVSNRIAVKTAWG